MAVITISRQYGSNGDYIGRKIADALGLPLVHKSEVSKVMQQYGLIAFEEMYQSHANLLTLFDQMRVMSMEFLSKVILAFAKNDNLVIVGRCSFAILNNYANVINVRIQAPLEKRIVRIAEREDVDHKKARKLIQEEDTKRAKLVETFYSFKWDLASAFNIVVDTGKFDPEIIVNWIVEAATALEISKPLEEPNTESIPEDPILGKVISNVLSNH